MLKYYAFALIPHASKVMLKILQARLQQYMNCKLPDVQAGFRKGRGTRNQIANIHWIIKKSKRVPEECLLLLAFDSVDHHKLWKILKQMGISDHLTCFLRNQYEVQEVCMKVKFEPDMEQQTGSKLGKEYVKAVYCHPAYLTSMQSTSCKMPDWVNTS